VGHAAGVESAEEGRISQRFPTTGSR
jgi:hypothetical protein